MVSKDVAQEMVSIFYRANHGGVEAAQAEVADLYKQRENLPYYTLMNFLIRMEFATNANQTRNLQNIFQPEVQKEWDMDEGLARDKKNPRDNKLRQPSNYSPYGKTASPPEWRMRNNTGPAGTKPFDERDPNQSVIKFLCSLLDMGMVSILSTMLQMMTTKSLDLLINKDLLMV